MILQYCIWKGYESCHWFLKQNISAPVTKSTRHADLKWKNPAVHRNNPHQSISIIMLYYNYNTKCSEIDCHFITDKFYFCCTCFQLGTMLCMGRMNAKIVTKLLPKVVTVLMANIGLIWHQICVQLTAVRSVSSFTFSVC